MSVTIDKNGKRHFHMAAETGHVLEEGKSLGLSATGVTETGVEEISMGGALIAYQLDVLREDGGTECAGTIVGPVLPRVGESVRLVHGGEYVVLKVLEVQHQLDKPEPPNISVVCCIVRRIARQLFGPPGDQHGAREAMPN